VLVLVLERFSSTSTNTSRSSAGAARRELLAIDFALLSQKTDRATIVKEVTEMRTRKITTLMALAVCAALAFGPRAFAKGSHSHADKMLAKLSKQLNLTDDQKVKIKPILEDQDSQLSALKTDKTLTKQQRHDRTAEIRNDTQEKITPILTPDQQQKWEAMKAKHSKSKAPTAPSAS
jgi:Spy/CpxP family protein refolding chaperone